MSIYRPSTVPSLGSPAIERFLQQELDRIARATADAHEYVRYEVLYAAPGKMSAGDVVYADGTSWNPGAGEGLYRRNKGNTAWVHLG